MCVDTLSCRSGDGEGRPGMLLSILQCIGCPCPNPSPLPHTYTTENFLAPRLNGTEDEKLCLMWRLYLQGMSLLTQSLRARLLSALVAHKQKSGLVMKRARENPPVFQRVQRHHEGAAHRASDSRAEQTR